jgi:hypothetical protein
MVAALAEAVVTPRHFRLATVPLQEREKVLLAPVAQSAGAVPMPPVVR